MSIEMVPHRMSPLTRKCSCASTGYWTPPPTCDLTSIHRWVWWLVGVNVVKCLSDLGE